MDRGASAATLLRGIYSASETEHGHLRHYAPSLSAPTGAIVPSAALGPFGPLSVAHYMPYLNGLSQMDLLQQYAALSSSFRPAANIAPHSPLFTSFGLPSVGNETTFAQMTSADKPGNVEDR